MNIFNRKNNKKENTSSGDENTWPLQIKEYFLHEKYHFTESKYPDVFLVIDGVFLHSFGENKQSLRKGASIVTQPGNSHSIIQPDNVHLVRFRYLPEWFANDFSLILSNSDLFSLFFLPNWFNYPSESSIHAFNITDEKVESIFNDVSFIKKILPEKDSYDSLVRISFLKLILFLSIEYGKYWRGKNRINLADQIIKIMHAVDILVNRGEEYASKKFRLDEEIKDDDIDEKFRKISGLNLEDYVSKRRCQISALAMIQTKIPYDQIIEKYGFNDKSDFTRSFERFFSYKPNEYREKFQDKKLAT